MKKLLKKIPIIYKVYSYFNYFRWQPETKDIHTILSKYATENRINSFIQIGAFDGATLDPIRNYILQYNWKGILVEPQKIAFDNLKKCYKDCNNLVFGNYLGR